MLTVIRPRRMVTIAGAEGMEQVMHDPRFHLAAFGKGLIFCVVGGLLLTGVVQLFF
jgi:hypothetical protein